jgi:hypothetical protein
MALKIYLQIIHFTLTKKIIKKLDLFVTIVTFATYKFKIN